MERKTLLLLLEKKLLERGIDGDFLKRQMSKIEMLLEADAGSSADSAANDASGNTAGEFDYITEDNIDGITEELYALLTRFQKNPPGIAAQDDEQNNDRLVIPNETPSNPAQANRSENNTSAGLIGETRSFNVIRDIKPAYNEINTQQTSVFHKVESENESPAEHKSSEYMQTREHDIIGVSDTRLIPRANTQPPPNREDGDLPPRKIESAEITFTPPEDGGGYTPLDTRASEGVPDSPPRGTLLFWILFAIASPFLLILSLTGALIFAAGFFGMALLIAVSFIVLIAVVAAGTATALIEIIYGITQLFKYVPIGLCEMGIGIIIAGAVMLSGILIYNGAVRLLPFLIKKFAALLGLTIKNTRKLYYFLKGECAKL